MKLIIERAPQHETLTESLAEGKTGYFIEGVFLQSEIKNRNGRRYPKGVMEAALDKYMSKVENGYAWGELGHPDGPKINEHRISHLTKKLEWQGNNVIGKAQLIDEGYGAIAIACLKVGGRLGVSSRGLGSLKNNNGIMEVQNDFTLATAADIVTDPSAPDAYVNGIMENVDWVYKAGQDVWVAEHVENTQKIIHNTPKARLDEAAKLRLFNDFLNKIKG
jgi:hypothetical protein